jgi:Domain of unknown function (DUF4214)
LVILKVNAMNFLKSKLVVMALALASLLTFSTAAQAGPYATQIQQLYVTFFGRPADPQGLAFWESTVDSAVGAGQTSESVLATVANEFAKSSEFNAGGRSSVQNIAQLYQNMFGRAPEPGGLLFWSGRLEQGQLTIGQIASALTANMQNPDKAVFDNKVTAATAFTDGVSSSTSLLLGYSGIPAVREAKAFLSGITSDASLQSAIAPAALNATILAVTNARDLPSNPVVDLAKNNATDAVSNAVTSTVSHVSESAVGSAVTAAANAAAKAATDAASKAAADAAARAAAAAVDEN